MVWITKIAEPDIGLEIKKRLLNSQSMLLLFEEFEVDPSRLSDLQIEIVDLDKKYAETDANVLKINKSLFKGGDFFRKYFFVIVHEIIHWLSRIREQDAYFNDPEEVLGFVASIAYEIEQGSSFDEIYNKIYGKIKWHFHDEEDARTFFDNMIDKAKSLIVKCNNDKH